MAELGIEPEEIRRLAQLVEANGLSELRYEEGDLRITIRTRSFQRSNAAITLAPPIAVFDSEEYEDEQGDATLPAPAVTRSGANLILVEAPIMGVFYRSAAPSDPPLIEVGDMVEVGQMIGVIEAMKVFSEVPSDWAGRVREIPGKNGGLVQPGDPLVILEAV